MTTSAALVAYLRRVGVEADTAVNVLTGGQLGQTVSERAAYGAGWRPTDNAAVAVQSGPRKRGWCLFCGFLSRAVQDGHCGMQFTDQATPGFDMIRAGIAFGVGFAALDGLAWAALRLVNRWL